MVEITELVESNPPSSIEKQLNDRSFGTQSTDSGLSSNSNGETSDASASNSDLTSGSSSGYESSTCLAKPMLSLKWENIEDEVVSASAFTLFMQSSNLMNQSRVCDISSIEHTGVTPILRKDGKYNSTAIGRISDIADVEIKSERKREHVWWAEGGKHEKSSDDRYVESEYSSTFADESTFNDSTASSNSDSFPISLNPNFDLQSLVMYGTCIKGAYFEDFSTLRVQDLSKIKSTKMIMTKTRVELSLIRPGVLSDDGRDGTIRCTEDKLRLLDVVAVVKIREVRMMVLKLKVLSEMVRESGESTGCFIRDLGALDCRAGCAICVLDKKAEKLIDGFPNVSEGPDCRNATLSILASLLSDCESPSWLLANEKLLTIVEYMLWDAARLGLSQHLSGTAPCLLYDLERLLALVRKALDGYFIDDLYKMNKIDRDEIEISLFNDNETEKPIYKREHLIHFQMQGIYGVSGSMFTNELRNWDGCAAICFKSKNRKKMMYAGRDIGDTPFSKKVIDETTHLFKGSAHIPVNRPPSDVKLYPIDAVNRTIIG